MAQRNKFPNAKEMRDVVYLPTLAIASRRYGLGKFFKRQGRDDFVYAVI